MFLDLNGIPAVVAGESTAPGTALAASIVTPEPLSASVQSIIRDLLDSMEGSASIIIDPNQRKITAATGAEGLALINAASIAKLSMIGVSPDANQVGRSLSFTKNIASDDAVVDAAVDATIATAKPKRSVESLVSTILSKEMPANAPVIAIDQTNGLVYVMLEAAPGDIQTAIDAVANAGDRVQIELSEPAVDGGAAPLVFEGGAV